jgi:hypothetical protein
MVASGCTAEQLAAVVKASLAEQEHRIADKRAKDAERQRRHRASRNVTVTERDSRDECDITPPSAPPNDIYSNPPHHPPLQKSGARKGSRLPDDWFPKPLPSELAAAVARWPDGEVEKQMAMFRDWAASAPGSKGIKSDWDAAWRNWLRRVDGERPRQSSPPRQAPSNANTLKLLREKLHGTGY